MIRLYATWDPIGVDIPLPLFSVTCNPCGIILLLTHLLLSFDRTQHETPLGSISPLSHFSGICNPNRDWFFNTSVHFCYLVVHNMRPNRVDISLPPIFWKMQPHWDCPLIWLFQEPIGFPYYSNSIIKIATPEGSHIWNTHPHFNLSSLYSWQPRIPMGIDILMTLFPFQMWSCITCDPNGVGITLFHFSVISNPGGILLWHHTFFEPL